MSAHRPGGRCHHKQLYRMSCEDFDGLVRYARGRCQICETPESETVRGKLVIDHDPRYPTIAVRGLLCDKCNRLMGEVDAGRSIDRRGFAYRSDAWFLRVLIARAS